MRRAIGGPTKAQAAYHDTCRALDCVVCTFRIRQGMQPRLLCGPGHLHHRNLDDRHGAPQLGHESVVLLGAYHHDGVLLPGYSGERMREVFGPSFFHHARDFRTWTADALPGYGRGTEAWQRWMNEEIERRRGQAA